MPFVSNQGVKIYYEVEGQGPALILGHGSTGNLTFWRGYGYVDKLKDSYSVILFDARAHGKSDKPHDIEAYDYRLMVRDVVAVLDALEIEKTHYWGYSMGGFMGLGLAKLFPERLLSLVIGGANPFKNRNDGEPLFLNTLKKGIVHGMDAVVAGMKELFGAISPQYEERLRSLDLPAIIACIEYAHYHKPGLDDALPHMNVPCFIYAGDADDGVYESGQKAAQQMPNAQFVALSGLNHVSASSAMDLIMPQVLAFLNTVDVGE